MTALAATIVAINLSRVHGDDKVVVSEVYIIYTVH